MAYDSSKLINLGQMKSALQAVSTKLITKEDTANKVTSISSTSTDMQYPSAKCVYDMIGDVESALTTLLEGGVSLISFTIVASSWTAGAMYQAEEGMTWAEWVASEYNIGPSPGPFVLKNNSDYVYDNGDTVMLTYQGTLVKKTETIIANGQYYFDF